MVMLFHAKEKKALALFRYFLFFFMIFRAPHDNKSFIGHFFVSQFIFRIFAIFYCLCIFSRKSGWKTRFLIFFPFGNDHCEDIFLVKLGNKAVIRKEEKMQVLHLLHCIKTNLGLQQNFAYHTEAEKKDFLKKSTFFCIKNWIFSQNAILVRDISRRIRIVKLFSEKVKVINLLSRYISNLQKLYKYQFKIQEKVIQNQLCFWCFISNLTAVMFKPYILSLLIIDQL